MHRLGGVHPLRTNERLPKEKNERHQLNQKKIQQLLTIDPCMTPEFDITKIVDIPIKSIYTDTWYKNHLYDDYDLLFVEGVYVFVGKGAALYIGKSRDVGNRLRAHILNYQRGGVESQSPFIGYSTSVRVLLTRQLNDLEKYMIKSLVPVWNQKQYR